MLRAFGLNGKHSLAEVCCQGDDDDVAGDDNDDVDDVGQIDFIALSTGCMSMMMKVTATFDRRTRLHIEHLQEREQDAPFSKPQSKDHAKERRNVRQQVQNCTTPATHQRSHSDQ